MALLLSLFMKRILPLLLLLAACKPAAPTAATQSGKPRVALVMKSLANEFFQTMAKGAEAHHAAHAGDYDLIVNGIKNETDLSEQVGLVELMVAQGVQALVIAPADSKALIPVLKRAQDAGVMVINIDNKLDADVLKQAGLNAAFVGPDNREGAKQVGDALAKKLSAGDEVAIIEGVVTAFNSQQRKAGFEEAMQAAGMKVVNTQSGQWEMEKANTVAAGILAAHANLKALLCANDNMALGAAAAVAAAGKAGQIKVVGFDNISALKPLLADGRVLATADQHGDQLATFGIEAALKALKQKQPAADQKTPVDLITQ
jgi:ribose transport system substrate-binding protein